MPKVFLEINYTRAAFTVRDSFEMPELDFITPVEAAEIPESIVRLNQVHSADIVEVFNVADISNCYNCRADGIITTLSDIALAISVADCAPVSLVDMRGEGIALLHAGWRGTRMCIVEKGVELMQNIGIARENISAYIGPAIKLEHYEVGEEFIQIFPKSIKTINGKLFFNLPGEIERRLKESGIRNIIKFPLSTYSTQWLHSYRREKDNVGRTEFLLWMNPERA